MNLYFETSYGSLNKFEEELCGDKVEIIRNEKEIILVLADGLGSGVKANILASLTSKIVSTMLVESMDVTEVIETIASTLPVCSERGIAYSTFSFIHINNEGEAYIVEFDNPDIVILRKGKVLDLPRNQLLVGDKIIKETRIKLQPDDYCVMFSDGVVHAGIGKMLRLGWRQNNVMKYLENSYTKDSTAYSMQNLLLNACNNLYYKEPGDDTTVAVCKIRTKNIAYIMVGPPVNSSDDEKLVSQLFDFEGTKIVCGGTTAQIVSRISKKNLRVSLNYVTPNVPPIGYIDGIDLVTEGIITLENALALMKKYEKSAEDRNNYFQSHKDGASLLVQLLVNKCTGAKFIVGRALNPAHQNPDMPIDLSIKLKLVNEISQCMKRLGKEVEVQYY